MTERKAKAEADSAGAGYRCGAKHFCKKHVWKERGGFSTLQTFDFWRLP
jgi:hypothetical protein